MLGLLSSPLTTTELAAMIAKTFDDEAAVELMRSLGTMDVVEALHRPGEVYRALRRLERKGQVTRAIGPRNEPHLWWRTDTDEEPL